jgi:hypothetical protein
VSQKNIAGMQNFTVAVSLVIVVALSGLSISCSQGDSDVSSNSSASGSPTAGVSANPASSESVDPRLGTITATPNPVPAGQGNGRTRISWKTSAGEKTSGDLNPVEVYVVQDANAEVKFAEGAEGTAEAPWIVSGSKYEFRLYGGKGATRKLINKVQVTRTQ